MVKIMNFQIVKSTNIIATPYKIMILETVSCIIQIIMLRSMMSTEYKQKLTISL